MAVGIGEGTSSRWPAWQRQPILTVQHGDQNAPRELLRNTMHNIKVTVIAIHVRPECFHIVLSRHRPRTISVTWSVCVRCISQL